MWRCCTILKYYSRYFRGSEPCQHLRKYRESANHVVNLKSEKVCVNQCQDNLRNFFNVRHFRNKNNINFDHLSSRSCKKTLHLRRRRCYRHTFFFMIDASGKVNAVIFKTLIILSISLSKWKLLYCGNFSKYFLGFLID